MRAMPSLRREVGISARSCNARFALRMRASMSATGSVNMLLPPLPSEAMGQTPLGENAPAFSPARFRHARDDALVCQVAQTDPAEPELLEHSPRPPAAVATRVRAHAELGRPGLLDA